MVCCGWTSQKAQMRSQYYTTQSEKAALSKVDSFLKAHPRFKGDKKDLTERALMLAHTPQAPFMPKLKTLPVAIQRCIAGLV